MYGHKAHSLFTEAGRGRAIDGIWTCPPTPMPAANHSSRLTSSTVCYFSPPTPEEQINNEALLLHPDAEPDISAGLLTGLSFSTKRQKKECYGKDINTSWWKLEHCLPFSLRYTFLGHHSIFIPNVDKLFFPLLLFPGNLEAQAAGARVFRKTAVDGDKNNYSSIRLPRDTLSTYSLPLQAASLSLPCTHNEVVVA